MSLEHKGADPAGDASSNAQPSNTDMATDPPQLTEAELQEKYRQEYLTQLRRLSCPGCGEDFSVF